MEREIIFCIFNINYFIFILRNEDNVNQINEYVKYSLNNVSLI